MNITNTILHITDERPDAQGDSIEIPCESLEAAHELAHTYNCGLYTIILPGAANMVFESDGKAPIMIHWYRH